MKRTGLVAGLMLFAAGASLFASRLWSWVLHFDPGFVFAHEPEPTGAPLSSGVTILLVDGMRLDASRRLPALNELRRRGADIEAQVGTPSFSRPGRATLAVGAPPAIHGVTTNRQKRALTLDNLIRRVGADGGTCRIAGSKIWPGLFAEDIARCGVYREGEGKEGPGAFVRQVPAIRANQEAGIAFVLERPALLRIADVISTDFAAHEYGGASTEYQAELVRADELIAELARRLDLSKETLVVTADHGHRDTGGHGGAEPSVLAIPIVMAGAGVRPLTTATASQNDLAPTVAAILGMAVPNGSAGRPLDSILLLDDAKRTAVSEASAGQKAAFDKAVGQRLGIPVGPGGRDWTELVRASRDNAARRHALSTILAAVLLTTLAAAAIRLAAPGAWSVAAGVVVFVSAVLGPIGSRLPVMSFSAINYDEMLMAYFQRIVILAALTTLAAIASALLVGRAFPKRPDSPVAQAGSMGLVGSTALAVATLFWWWNNDLLSPLTLPGPDRLVEAYSLTLSTLSVSVTTLAVVGVLWLVESRARVRE